MSILSAISKNFGTAMVITALTLTGGVSAFSQMAPRLSVAQLMDQAKADTLFSQVSNQLETAKEHAETLRTFAKHPDIYAREEYGIYLNELGVAINKAQEDVRQIQNVRKDLNPLQVETAAKAESDLNAMARLTEDSINIFDQQQSPFRLASTKFANDLDQVYQEGDASHRVLRDYLTFAHDSARANRAITDLERAS